MYLPLYTPYIYLPTYPYIPTIYNYLSPHGVPGGYRGGIYTPLAVYVYYDLLHFSAQVRIIFTVSCSYVFPCFKVPRKRVKCYYHFTQFHLFTSVIVYFWPFFWDWLNHYFVLEIHYSSHIYIFIIRCFFIVFTIPYLYSVN